MYPQSMFLAKKKKKSKQLQQKIVIFTGIEICSILHRRTCYLILLQWWLDKLPVPLLVTGGNRSSRQSAKNCFTQSVR